MIGFSVQAIERRVSPEFVRKFRSLPVANVSDCMSRLTGGGPRLRPYHGEGVLSGPAFTVKTRPGDNLMVHKALEGPGRRLDRQRHRKTAARSAADAEKDQGCDRSVTIRSLVGRAERRPGCE